MKRHNAYCIACYTSCGLKDRLKACITQAWQPTRIHHAEGYRDSIFLLKARNAAFSSIGELGKAPDQRLHGSDWRRRQNRGTIFLPVVLSVGGWHCEREIELADFPWSPLRSWRVHRSPGRIEARRAVRPSGSETTTPGKVSLQARLTMSRRFAYTPRTARVCVEYSFSSINSAIASRRGAGGAVTATTAKRRKDSSRRRPRVQRG